MWAPAGAGPLGRRRDAVPDRVEQLVRVRRLRLGQREGEEHAHEAGAEEHVGDLVRIGVRSELASFSGELEERDDRVAEWPHDALRVRLGEGRVALELAEQPRYEPAREWVRVEPREASGVLEEP